MGFKVRAVHVGYFRCMDPSKGFERKYPGDEFEVEEQEFSDYHRPPRVINGKKVTNEGWMEKIEDYPQPSFEINDDQDRKPEPLVEAAKVAKVTGMVPQIDARPKRRGRPPKARNAELTGATRTADEPLKGQ